MEIVLIMDDLPAVMREQTHHVQKVFVAVSKSFVCIIAGYFMEAGPASYMEVPGVDACWLFGGYPPAWFLLLW
jgi:hypothetical protein